MDHSNIKKMLEDIAAGKISPHEGLDKLSALPFADLDIAKHDGHRPLRNGFSEVILCEGKRLDHVMHIVRQANAMDLNILGTRADESLCEKVTAEFGHADVDVLSRTFRIVKHTPTPMPGKLAVLAAGTADLFVAEEAVRTAEFFGSEPSKHYDIGVAGIHRLLSCVDSLKNMDVLIVVAGMEGALPSVVGGLVPAPIVAVPTSVGYGTNFAGVAALLGMLNSCSEGITVVNIDNGFGAACAAVRILRCLERKPSYCS
ncbi:MAG: nickel pincer cofactor biosynthesis protein LarB [Pseudomonadota bacterium]